MTVNTVYYTYTQLALLIVSKNKLKFTLKLKLSLQLYKNETNLLFLFLQMKTLFKLNIISGTYTTRLLKPCTYDFCLIIRY